jgi:hypothetical protein
MRVEVVLTFVPSPMAFSVMRGVFAVVGGARVPFVQRGRIATGDFCGDCAKLSFDFSTASVRLPWGYATKRLRSAARMKLVAPMAAPRIMAEFEQEVKESGSEGDLRFTFAGGRELEHGAYEVTYAALVPEGSVRLAARVQESRQAVAFVVKLEDGEGKVVMGRYLTTHRVKTDHRCKVSGAVSGAVAPITIDTTDLAPWVKPGVEWWRWVVAPEVSRWRIPMAPVERLVQVARELVSDKALEPEVPEGVRRVVTLRDDGADVVIKEE